MSRADKLRAKVSTIEVHPLDLPLRQVALLRGFETQAAIRAALAEAGYAINHTAISLMFRGVEQWPKIHAAVGALLFPELKTERDRVDATLQLMANERTEGE